jgi:hypothetical protein
MSGGRNLTSDTHQVSVALTFVPYARAGEKQIRAWLWLCRELLPNVEAPGTAIPEASDTVETLCADQAVPPASTSPIQKRRSRGR